MDKIRVLFMGTPDFAVGCLDMLLNREDIEIVGVVTQPDRQSGRGYKLLPPAVKAFALEKELEVFQPLTVKDEAFENYIKEREKLFLRRAIWHIKLLATAARILRKK